MKRIALLLGLLLFVSTFAEADERIRLGEVKTEWQNLYGIILYSATAKLENRSNEAVRFVKVKLELFDKNGDPVASKEGYNLAAEALGDDTVPGTFDEKLARITPIPPGGSDPIRISLDKGDIGKPFRKAVVSIVEVR
jgi:hypothetical protein